jgi:hypothetical protein
VPTARERLRGPRRARAPGARDVISSGVDVQTRATDASVESTRDAIRELEVEWALALGTEGFALLRELVTELVSHVVEHPH